MPGLRPDVDPQGLLEYSVVFSDRGLNHMSQAFQQVMRDVSATLTEVYAAEAAVVVPGSGSFGMEAVARQFATDRRCLVIRNGWFSYRWSQIFERGRIPAESTVLKARPVAEGRQAAYAPPPLEEALAAIAERRPDLVFAPHVETASGIILPDAYLRAVADAVHAVGGLFILDCVASGAIWVDMKATGVDVLISAPQKGWSASPCCALVMLSERATTLLGMTTSTSYACDLARWKEIMDAYLKGGHAYHATLPTDGLRRLRNTMAEIRRHGLERARAEQWELGNRVREALARRGFASVAAAGFEAPGVVVSYADDPDIHNGRKFAAQGLQTAAGVPLQCDEPSDFRTFRIGLFGLDKLQNVGRTVASLEHALDAIG
jgi:aspartate aminotransferase-like enzyme